MSQEDDVLGGLGHQALHQALEELGEVAPGLLAVGGAEHVDALVHVEQVRERVHHDGVDLGQRLRVFERFVDLQRVGDGVLLELGLERQLLAGLTVQVHDAFGVLQAHQRRGLAGRGLADDQHQVVVDFLFAHASSIPAALLRAARFLRKFSWRWSRLVWMRSTSFQP